VAVGVGPMQFKLRPIAAVPGTIGLRSACDQLNFMHSRWRLVSCMRCVKIFSRVSYYVACRTSFFCSDSTARSIINVF